MAFSKVTRQILGAMAFLIAGPTAAVSQDSSLPPASKLFPGSQPLDLDGDIASTLVDGVDQFLLRKIEESRSTRTRRWKRDFSSPGAYSASIAPNRTRLTELIGAIDDRVRSDQFLREKVVATSVSDALEGYRVYPVRWPVLPDPDPRRSITSIFGYGLLIEPIESNSVVANIVAIPECGQSPQQVCGITQGIEERLQFARRLGMRNCRVLIPMTINREVDRRGGRTRLTNREFVYRPAFELGRHVIGFEVQSLRAGIDCLPGDLPIGVIGSGEGGRLALFTAAIDIRIDGVCLGGSFGDDSNIWKDPIDRNLFGYLSEFGSAELLSMIAPRKVLVNHAMSSRKDFDGSGGGAPGSIRPISLEEGVGEVRRAKRLAEPLIEGGTWTIDETDYTDAPCEQETVDRFLELLIDRPIAPVEPREVVKVRSIDESAIHQTLLQQMDRHTQLLLRESAFDRKEYFNQLETDSLKTFTKTVEPYRVAFRDDVIGAFEQPLLSPSPRVRKKWEGKGWTGYEVVLDVFPSVIAYGALLLPNDLNPGERRPVVVCQHGLEGRPTDTFLGNHRAYHDFAAKLAERGFITFAPQNLYLFKDRFRTLQRKANPIGKTIFSVIVPQHQQIVDWLKSLDFVDGERIAFYGLSYGGKSAMRIPALVTDYSLSICSADFNEWVRKNASTRHRFSYVETGEYEIFEWNLGSTFNYAEMAALICPRPFMVERGHFDGVGADEWVAYEYAKVRNLYSARLGIEDRTEIEWFVGPHTIHGKGTFEFLHKHLRWPRPPED